MSEYGSRPVARLPTMPPEPNRPMWRRAAARGIRQISPLMLTAGPFGLIYGATAADTDLAAGLAIANSWIILAGAAQIAIVELISEDAPWVVAVGTALVINMRFTLYSASLAPAFREFPMRWRIGLAYLMTDQTALTSLIEYEEITDPRWRRWFYLGAGCSYAGVWWAGSTIGVLLGGDIPDGVQLGFAVPLTFLALLVPTLRDRPTAAAAAAGAAVCIATAALPNSLNLIVGAIAGVAVGVMVSRR